MADRQQLSEVTRRNHIRILKRLKHSRSFGCHLRMAAEDMLPTLIGKPNRDAIDGGDERHESRYATLDVQSRATTLYGRGAFGLTSRTSSRSGRVMVGVGPVRSSRVSSLTA